MKNLLYARGTNQYKKRLKNSSKGTKSRRTSVNGQIGAYVFLLILSLVVGHYVVTGIVSGIDVASAWTKETFIFTASAPTKYAALFPRNEEIWVFASASASEKKETIQAPIKQEKTKDPAIEAYMQKIFGPDFRTARAVSHNECNPLNAKYPACILHSDVEYSVGLFQINLYNATQWIHAGRIPGKTMDEKVAWLKDPYNNILYAYWVFKTSGWHPWTAYTSGNYLRDM